MGFSNGSLLPLARASLLLVVVFSGLANAQSTTGGTCGTQCNGNVLCAIESFGQQLYCAASGEFHQLAGGATNSLYSALFSVVLSTPSFGDSATRFYQEIVYVTESILLVFLLFSGVRLMYSSVISASERAEAKQNVQQVLVNMFLVGVSMPLYLLALDVTKSLAAAVAPSSADFNSAIFATLVSSSFFSVILLTALLLAVVFSILRFTLAFVGLFLLPFALAFESFWVTESIGRGLKLLIATNFVVQVLQALFLNLLVIAMASNNSFIIADNGALLLAVGTLVLGTWVTAKLYANAFEFHPGSAVNPVAIAGTMAGGLATQKAYQALGRKNAAEDNSRQDVSRRTMAVDGDQR